MLRFLMRLVKLSFDYCCRRNFVNVFLFFSLFKNFFYCFGYFWLVLVILIFTVFWLVRFVFLGFLMEMFGYLFVIKLICFVKFFWGIIELNIVVVSFLNVVGIFFIDWSIVMLFIINVVVGGIFFVGSISLISDFSSLDLIVL